MTTTDVAHVARTRGRGRIKGPLGWLVLLVVVLVALGIGTFRSPGPRSDDDRVDEISRQLACPTCDGESVFESQSAAAIGIRKQIKALIQEGTFSDGQIITYIEDAFDAQTQLVPKGSGFESLVWILPVVVFVGAVAGLIVAFRRWRMADDTAPSDSDRALVEHALLAEMDDTRPRVEPNADTHVER